MPLALIVTVVLLLGAAGPTPAVDGWWLPPAGISWDIQFAIDPDADLVLPEEAIEAIDLDGEETSARTVAALHSRGIRTLCYVNVGAWEEWRADAGAYPDEILGNDYAGWAGERFVDVRELDALGPIIEARFDDCAAKGFDAIEPDNIDTVFADTGFPLTEADQLAFNRWIADEAHARGLAVFQKNIPELAPELVDRYDGAITEDCAADGWCPDMAAYLEDGKPVLGIEYTDVTDDETFAGMCVDGDLAGVSLILKNRDLDAARASCETVGDVRVTPATTRGCSYSANAERNAPTAGRSTVTHLRAD